MASQTNFKAYLRTASKEIEVELKAYSRQLDKETENFKKLKKLINRFTNSFFGGKMVRGTLVKLGYDLVVSKPNQEIIKPAVAFEILHTSLLIHDDIIDRSPTRRSKPALHVNKNKHYGISQAICLGDLGIVLANRLIAQCDFPPERKNKAHSYFSKIIADTILGEMLDIESAQTLKRAEKQILIIQKMKTAQYTIVGPLSLGAILGGATDNLLEAIKQFGELLGTGYQIRDDILGIFGDENTIGKSTTSDIEENKNTLLITYAMKHGNKQQIAILNNLYGKKIALEQQEKVKQVFIETGALAYSQNMIKKLNKKAHSIIPYLSSNEEKQKLLTSLADLLIERKK